MVTRRLFEAWNRPCRYNRHALVSIIAVAATGWVVAAAVFLGSSRPPIPGLDDLSPWSGVPSSLIGHLVIFGALGLLVSTSIAVVAPSASPIRSIAGASLVGILLGIITEWYQTTVPARSGNLEDILVDVLGAMTGGLIVGVARPWLMQRIRRVRPWDLRNLGSAGARRASNQVQRPVSQGP